MVCLLLVFFDVFLQALIGQGFLQDHIKMLNCGLLEIISFDPLVVGLILLVVNKK